jgi:phenylacetate-CoA ligase
MLNILVEVVGNGERRLGPGEVGDILVTTLTNTAMPLIRYRIGDAAMMSPDECSCGRRGEVLKSIEGRNDDFLKTRSGRKPPMMARLALYQPPVKGYRIVQESIGKMRVELKGEEIDEETRATIYGKLREVMEDPDLAVDFVDVDEIEPDPSGKRRVVICRA